eukprot:scaffold20.g7858.t1
MEQERDLIELPLGSAAVARPIIRSRSAARALGSMYAPVLPRVNRGADLLSLGHGAPGPSWTPAGDVSPDECLTPAASPVSSPVGTAPIDSPFGWAQPRLPAAWSPAAGTPSAAGAASAGGGGGALPEWGPTPA